MLNWFGIILLEYTLLWSDSMYLLHDIQCWTGQIRKYGFLLNWTTLIINDFMFHWLFCVSGFVIFMIPNIDFHLLWCWISFHWKEYACFGISCMIWLRYKDINRHFSAKSWLSNLLGWKTRRGYSELSLETLKPELRTHLAWC